MIQTGTVISGTHRNEDLLKAFAQELEALADEAWKMETSKYKMTIDLLHEAYNIKETLRMHPSLSEDELMSLLVDGLQVAINEYAPGDMYFGTSEGDGADFGYWEVEEESG